MKELRTLLDELIDLNNEEWDAFNRAINEERFQSKTTIIKEGSIANKIYFIQSGLLRTYYLEEGKEVTTYFSCGGQFIGTFTSFISQQPSAEILETIAESVTYSLTYTALNLLYKKHPKFERLGRIWAEKNYLCTIERTTLMQTKTGKQKYLDFIKNYDKRIVLNAPQHQIASFLGITPESLSRIRKEIAIS
ncbi:MAG: Crp/Fnr family transcriptional regulator [Flavobacteriales bacterium]|jgi:CRP-like cAMP-binding protein|nr:Crp/Fnr family transcriptional regulator [Flavobacteriales bacterium]